MISSEDHGVQFIGGLKCGKRDYHCSSTGPGTTFLFMLSMKSITSGWKETKLPNYDLRINHFALEVNEAEKNIFIGK